MRVRREEWAKRVARWSESGLTAKEFASELGINPRTLVFWKWQLSKGGAGIAKAPTARSAVKVKPLPLIELSPPKAVLGFELELRGGHRLIIPPAFDADALRRLLTALEASS